MHRCISMGFVDKLPGRALGNKLSQFKSYWLTVVENVQSQSNIVNFCSCLTINKLVCSIQPNCLCKQVCLEVFVAYLTDDGISLDIKNAAVAFDGNDSDELKYIMDIIEISYDAELIVRYQEFLSAR